MLKRNRRLNRLRFCVVPFLAVLFLLALLRGLPADLRAGAVFLLATFLLLALDLTFLTISSLNPIFCKPALLQANPYVSRRSRQP